MGINKDEAVQLSELDVENARRHGEQRLHQSLMNDQGAQSDQYVVNMKSVSSMKSPFSINQRDQNGEDEEEYDVKIINPTTPGSAVLIRRYTPAPASSRFDQDPADDDPLNPNPNPDGDGDGEIEADQAHCDKLYAPEKKLTLFAMRLAVLEKIASTVGTLGFVWATVVLLGGYAITLKEIDFWFVTIILITEGTRIFMRSHELEWQHQDSGGEGSTTTMKAYNAIGKALSNISSLVSPRPSPAAGVDAGSRRLSSARRSSGDDRGRPATVHKPHLGRSWSSHKEVSFVPFMGLLFKAKRVSIVLYTLQIASALLSIALSLWRLILRDFIRPGEGDTEKNHTSALLIFYSLTVVEAVVFLTERAYWQYQISVKKILEQTSEDCQLHEKNCYTVRRFFYDVYEKCLTQSVFDGLKMDLVDYALQWLQSDSPAEQLHGARTLKAFSGADTCKEVREDTLRTIGTRQGAVERLLEMATWKNEEEQEVRETAAALLCNLVNYDRTGIRVASVSGSIEAIFTLIHDDSLTEQYSSSAHEFARANTQSRLARRPPRVTGHVRSGLRILIHLARNPMNCSKIGATRGLLPLLVSFVDVTKWTAAGDFQREDTVLSLSLQLLSLLAACEGPPGKILRLDIANVLPAITNLRNILNMYPPNPHLQKLAAATLSSLAMDAAVREVIGRVGGVMRSLFCLFLLPEPSPSGAGDCSVDAAVKKQMKVAIKTGHALSLLALQDRQNCHRMLRVKLPSNGVVDRTSDEEAPEPRRRDVLDALIEMMKDRQRGYLAIFILYCFCENGVLDDQHEERILESIPEVMSLVMEKEDKVQEAAIGLVAKALHVTKSHYKEEMLLCDGKYTKEGIVDMIGSLLQKHKLPSVHLPRLRRFCLELVIVLAEVDPSSFLPLFESHNFVEHLDYISANASDMENYATFSGAIGTVFLPTTIEYLVQTTISKLSLHDKISFS